MAVAFALSAVVQPTLSAEILPYTPHAPIIIDGDGDLVAANGVRGGTGTAEDPYRISGWAIVSPIYPLKEGAIKIYNTTKHVVVSENLLTMPFGGTDGHYCSIFMKNVSHTTISANRIRQTMSGICALESEDIHVEDNELISHLGTMISRTAIVLVDTHNSSATGNRISGFLQGIGLGGQGRDTLIANNVLRGNGPGGGIAVYPPSVHVEVRDNVISRHYGSAIQIYGDFATVANNTVSDSDHGMAIGFPLMNAFPVGVLIKDNTFKDMYSVFNTHGCSCMIRHNLVDQAEFFLAGWARDGLSFEMSHNIFRGDGEIYHRNFTAHNNSFPTEFLLQSTPGSDLRHNWWGSPDGPQNVTITGSPRYEPWLTSEPENVGPRR